MPASDLVAASGASHILNTSTNLVRRLARRGELPVAVVTPIAQFYRRVDVERLAAAREAQRSPAATKIE